MEWIGHAKGRWVARSLARAASDAIERSVGGSRRTLVVALVAALGSGCGRGGDGGAGASRFLSIGTGGTGGIYYPLGGALASLMSVADPSRTYTAEVTGGAAENLNRIRAGQIELAFSTANSIYDAYYGSPDFGEPMEELRIVAPLYPNFTHILIAQGSAARSVADFRGLKVSVGAPGSGTEQMSRRILEVYGLSYDDVDARYLTFTESAAALKDRAIDAALISVGYPAAAVLEATTTGGARLLPMERDKIRDLTDRYPYFAGGEIPAGAYPGMDADVPTAVLLNWIVASERLSNEIVMSVLSVLTDQRAGLERVHDMARQIDLDYLRDAPIPLHSGTEQWWLEGR